MASDSLIHGVVGDLGNGHTCELARGIDSTLLFTAAFIFDDEIDRANFEAAKAQWQERKRACDACRALSGAEPMRCAACGCDGSCRR